MFVKSLNIHLPFSYTTQLWYPVLISSIKATKQQQTNRKLKFVVTRSPKWKSSKGVNTSSVHFQESNAYKNCGSSPWFNEGCLFLMFENLSPPEKPLALPSIAVNVYSG